MCQIEQQALFEQVDDIEIAASSNFNYDDFDYQPSLLDKVKPSNRKSRINKAINYFWGNGLLYRIIKSKVDLTISGFKIVHEDKKINRKYGELNRKLDMETFVKRMLFQYFLIGEYYPYEYWNNNEPAFLYLLNPELVTVETALGNDFVYMRPPKSIRRIMRKDDVSTKKLKKLMPNELFKEWKKGKEAYLEGASRYSNLRQYHEQYAHLPIEPIFPDLQIMETLQEADYAVARKLRQLILHVKVGNKEFNKGKPVDKSILNDAKEYFQDNDMSRTMEIFTQYFVDAEYIHPPIEIFSSEKYEGVRERIVQWSGMGFLLEGNSSYSEASEKVKVIKEEIQEAREMVRKTINSFYARYAKRNNYVYYGSPKTPKIMFSKTPLMNDELLFKVHKFLYQAGILSIDDILDYYGYDKKSQIRKKLEEKEYLGDLFPVFESSQALLEGIYKEKGIIPNNKGGEQ